MTEDFTTPPSSEPPSTEAPQTSKPRLVTGAAGGPKSLVGVPTDPQSVRPKTLLGGGGSFGNLKVSMTPQQLAAIERAKEAQAQAEAMQQAQAEAQAKYEEELRAYEAYQAAERARLQEEARLAGEQAAAMGIPTPNIDPTLGTNPATQGVPMPTAPTMAPMPTLTASPAITPTAPVSSAALRRPVAPGMTMAQDETKPIWKHPLVIAILAISVLGGGFYVVFEQMKQNAIKEENDRYVNLIRQGTLESVPVIAGANKDDIKLLMDRYKSETASSNWAANAETLKKICIAEPSLAIDIVDDIIKNPNDYSLDKKKRILFLLATQKQPLQGLRDKYIELSRTTPDEKLKAEVVRYMGPLLRDEDLTETIIPIINEQSAKDDNPALRRSAEDTAARIIRKSEDQRALFHQIRAQYDAADDVGKNIYIRLMGQTGDENGLDFLKKILDEESTPATKRNVLKALGKWPNDDALPILMNVLNQPFGQNPETVGFLMDELYGSLAKPGRTRDMAKFKPLLDYLKGKNQKQADKLVYIRFLGGNAKTDKWAIDELTAMEQDPDDKVSFDAERAKEVAMKREAPASAKKAEAKPGEEQDDSLPTEDAPEEEPAQA